MNTTIADILKQHLDRSDTAYFENCEGPLIVGIYFPNAILHILIRPDEAARSFSANVFAGVCVPHDRRPAVAEWVVRANLNLRFGRFEFDFDHGDVNFAIALAIGDREPCDAELKAILGGSCNVYDEYLPSLMSVAFGGVSPAEAIASIENPNPAPSEDEFVRLMERLVPEYDEDEDEEG